MTWDLGTLAAVNHEINQREYVEQIGDDWNPWTTNGFDCNNYATVKQERLFALGVPREAMRLATCFVEEFQLRDPVTGLWRWAMKRERYHAVLLIDVGNETLCLCNRKPYPTEVSLTGYELHKIWNHELEDWEWARGADRRFG